MSSCSYGNNSDRACGPSDFVRNGKSSRKGGNGGAGKHNKGSGSKNSSGGGKRECLNCRSTDHSAKYCPHSCGWCGMRGHKKDFCHRKKKGEPPCEGSPWMDIFLKHNPETGGAAVEVQRETYDARPHCVSHCASETAAMPNSMDYAQKAAKFVTDEDLVALRKEQQETHMRMLKDQTGVDYSLRVALKMHVEGCPCPNCRVPCGTPVEEPELVVRRARRMNGKVPYTVTTFSGGNFSSWEEIPATEITDANTNRKIQDYGKFCFYKGDIVVVVYLFVKDGTAEKTQISAINRDLTKGLPAVMRANFQVHKTVTHDGTPICPPDAIVGLMRVGAMPAELEIADLIWATGVFTFDEWESFTDFCADKTAVLEDQQRQHQMDVDRFYKFGPKQVEFPTYVLFTVPDGIPPDVSEYELKPLIERSVPGCLPGIRRGSDRISCDRDGTITITRLPYLNRSIPSTDTEQLERWKSSVAKWFAKNRNGLVRQIRCKHKELKEAAAARKSAAAAKALPTAQMTWSKGSHRSKAAKGKESKGFGPTSQSSVGKCLAKSVEPVRTTETVERPVVSDAEVAEVVRIIKAETKTPEEEKFRAKIVRLLAKLSQSHRLQSLLKKR